MLGILALMILAVSQPEHFIPICSCEFVDEANNDYHLSGA